MAQCVIKVTNGNSAEVVREFETYDEALTLWYVLDDKRLEDKIPPSQCYYAVRDSEDPTGLMEMAMYGIPEEELE